METVMAISFDDLSEELKEKVRACKNPEEIFALAKEEGVELDEKDLEAIDGGMVSGWSIPGCPKFDGQTKRVK
jgi:hypothetical protein